MTSRRAISAFALFSYLAAVLLFPVLHRLHHLAHGDDHIHTDAGTIYFGAHPHDDDDDDDDDDDHDHDDHHHDDHDLAHSHHHDHDDPGHGAGSLEHAQAHYACAAPIFLPPPSVRFVVLVLEHTYDAPGLRFRSTTFARGPPARG